MNEKTQIETLIIHLRDFLKENLNVFILNTYEKIARFVSGITSMLFLVFLLGFILFFVSVGIALWLGRLLDETYVGFLMVGGFYLLIAILFYLNRKKWIELPMIDVVLKNMSDETN